jgi:pimeloyl-ACP methyl ester carboxylesterase
LPGIHYKEEGAGYPIFLIHGFCETHEIWKLVAEKLKEEYRILSIDLPGFGKSAPLPASHSLSEVADTVIEFISNKLGIDHCIVLGHSLGGYVVMAMAEKKPQLFDGLGLIHSTAYADTEERRTSRNKVIAFVREHGVEPFIRSFIPPLFYDQKNPHLEGVVTLALRTSQPTLVAYTEAMRNRPDRSHVLKSFPRPVLFLGGKEDSIISATAMQALATIAESPYVAVLDSVGHMGMLENEEDTYRVISDFIRSVVGQHTS